MEPFPTTSLELSGEAESVRRALVVEREYSIRKLFHQSLQDVGFEVETCTEGTQALQMAATTGFDLIVLDSMLPGLDGATVCRRIRSGGSSADSAVFMVSAGDSELDPVLGLDSGADDYITTPFCMREFLARVRAVLRRHLRERRTAATVVRRGPLCLDVQKRLASVRNQPVDLTRQEFDILCRMAMRPGMVFTRAALLQAGWDDDDFVNERTVDAVVSRLRRKIEADPRVPALILTAWGSGYRFADAWR